MFAGFSGLWLLLTEPGQHLLVSGFDGMKNYFTFQAYVQQPAAYGMRWFGMMNYPFGDYIFYTDNTPLLAWLVRLWSRYVSDVSPWGIDIYHVLLLAGMLLSTGLLVAILHRILHYWGLIVVFSVVLPWLNPQLGRLLMGHFNLSYSWVILLAIWGLMRLYDRAEAGQPIGRLVAGLTTAFTLISFVHLYYLPQLALLTAAFFALWLLPNGRWRQQPLLLMSTVLTLAPMLLSVGFVRLVDAYYSLRLTTPTGFNTPAWKLQALALIQPYAYETTHFIFEPTKPVSEESQAYLGAFALFGLVVALIGWVFRRALVRQWWRSWGQLPQQRLLLLLGVASLAGFFASVGTVYEVEDGQFTWHNYLSVFFYLHKITGAAAHFRTVARFCWPFFWMVNLLVVAGLDYWLRIGRWTARWVVVVALVLLASSTCATPLSTTGIASCPTRSPMCKRNRNWRRC
ncbi:hypothetical protein [Hymenobacter sp. AT01-02]|uniref:hypothetical protein n=1 Tax=Hymenobacter sp. AT01-02 TaxID=1571877 RepID=UPI0005F23957|nr:hypothetical protein [Hymenobacter sp. AT01-02]